jgi:hypothetical protein
MILVKTALVTAALAAGLLTAPPSAAKPSRIPEPLPRASSRWAAATVMAGHQEDDRPRVHAVATEFFRSQNERRYDDTCRLFSRGFCRTHRLRALLRATGDRTRFQADVPK